MFGFPFVTSLIVAVTALALISLVAHKGLKRKQQAKEQ